jgi:hypothetical protein
MSKIKQIGTTTTGKETDAALLQLVGDFFAAEAVGRKLSRARSETSDRAFNAAVSKAGRLADKVARKRALTLAGIVGKARVATVEGAAFSDFAATIGLSISRDLLALAKSACGDGVRS